MFRNLEEEMAIRKISLIDLSMDKELELSYETLISRFNGITEWKSKEMCKIKKKYFPDKKMEYLFSQS